MKKPWSISTTVRNPERILPFLRVLKSVEGEVFDLSVQKKFQILLIQNRLYKPLGLSDKMMSYYETSKDRMTLTEAEEVFEHMRSRSRELQNDEGLRGRTSVAPLTKMGLAIAKKSSGTVKITRLGNAFLDGRIDIGDIYFRFFLKWQIPNLISHDYKAEDGYNIKPFIGALHLIDLVNQKEISRGGKSKGIDKKEFSLFVPTLVNYRDIDGYAEQIINLRTELSKRAPKERKVFFENYKKKFASEFLASADQSDILNLLSNLKDYGDNAIRYFRLTRYFYIRGGGFYIDLESRRSVEIQSLLTHDDAASKHFDSKDEYLNYISDISQPKMPWETSDKYIEIIEKLVNELKFDKSLLPKKDMVVENYNKMSDDALKKYIESLRTHRKMLQEEKNRNESQKVDQINYYIESLENIFDFDDRPILLEKLSAFGLRALNDALKVQPNYPVGDDNEPTFTAPANTPDIECHYESYNAICEVTMLTSRDQWYNEGQPVMRHLRDFENKDLNKPSYCLFIAPKLHRDTINTFWTAIKYEYEGRRQKIVPLSIKNFVSLLKILLEIKNEGKFLKHTDISRLYDNILDSSDEFNDSGKWLQSIPNTISSWQKSLSL